jgi:hypothetical protein
MAIEIVALRGGEVVIRWKRRGYSRNAPSREPLAKTMQQVWIAFARTGDAMAKAFPLGRPTLRLNDP